MRSEKPLGLPQDAQTGLARVQIVNEERSRKRFLRRYFGADVDAPSRYDLVINMDAVSPESAVAIIAGLILK